MDAGERIIIDYAWRSLLEKQEQERQQVKDFHETEREIFYRLNKYHFDTRDTVGNGRGDK